MTDTADGGSVALDRYRVDPGTEVNLADWPTRDASPPDREASEAETKRLNKRLDQLQEQLFADGRHKVLVVLQAMDTGGKDGTIRRVFDGVNPAGVRVASFKKPTDIELAHDYLWRVHAEAPRDGQIVIFNRSHYEDVLVVRVHELVPEARWRRRYHHIREFERCLVEEGTSVLKLFLHISADEQRERLQARIDDPAKRWKFNEADLAERKLWDDYQTAYAEALSQTSTALAPWWVIPADRKWYRNLVVSRLVVDVLDRLDLAWPAAPPGMENTTVV